MTFILGMFYLLVLCAGIASMAVLVLRGRKTAYNRVYLLCQGMAMLWCAAQLLSLFRQSETEWKLAYLLGNLGICFIGCFWYYFALLYTERQYHPLEKLLPFALSVFHYAMFLTNGWHHLYYQVFSLQRLEHGVFFYTNVAQTYLLVIGGAVLLYRDFKQKKKDKRGRQLIIAAVLIPVLFNALYLSGCLPRASFDITPMGFGISVILVLVATMKYQFMDVNTTAFALILSGLSDGIGVFARSGKNAYANEVFWELLEIDADSDELLDFGRVFAQIKAFHPLQEKDSPVYVNAKGCYLQVQLYQSRKVPDGGIWSDGEGEYQEVALGECADGLPTVIMVHDMSRYYAMLQQTKELAATSQRLALEQERNRIAQQVHDTAGHTLTMLQSYMKLAMLADKDEETAKAQEYLTQARALASDGLKELRQSINQMRKEQSCELLTQGIVQLADQVKEIPVELTVQGEDSEKYSYLTGICYACVREAITNSLKYADASKIEIILRFQPEGVELTFGDNGKGCAQLKENHGIRGIRERVEEAGGTVRFVTAQGEGFLMRLCLPL